jgi:error-prone DNA polymerase
MHSILHARSKCGKFLNLDDAMKRSRINRSDIEKMILAGAFDSMESDRRSALWRAGLISKTIHTQRTLSLPVDQDIAQLPLMNNWESMLGEYKTMGIHPNGHLMAHIRKKLPSSVVTSEDLVHFEQGSNITVAGLVIRRQHPATDVVFVTLEDEFGHVPLVIWPRIFEKYRLAIKEPVLKVQGFVSRRDQTFNIVAQNIEHIDTHYDLPHSRNWE